MTDPDEEYADDLEYEDEADPFEEDFEEVKPEPISFPDAYSAALAKPVELEVPGHSDAFSVIGQTKESRFPAKQVARSAAALAKTLKSAARK